MRTSTSRALPWLLLALGATLGAGCGDGDEGGTTKNPDGGGAGDGAGAPSHGGAGGGAGPEAGGAGEAGTGGESGSTTTSCGAVDVAALTDAAWDPRFTIAGLSGHDGITPTVYDFAVDADGSVLATGRFAYYQGKAVTPLLRLRDGAWQPEHEAWTKEPPADGFAALALATDGTLALATADSFGDRDGEIWLDQAGEQRVIASFNGQVRALAWFDGALYVAGAFELSDAPDAISNLAVWDGATWSAPSGGAPDGPALELLVSDGALYVGGAFTSIGGVESANVASFDGDAWTPLPLTDALAVYALTRSDAGELYAGGALGELSAAGGIVKRVGDEWQIVGGGLAQFQTRGVVSDLIAHDGVVDAMGCFSSAGGLADAEGSLKAESLARWTGNEWQSLNRGSATASPWFQPGVCGDEGIGALWDMEYQRLAVADDRLFAGGSFAGVEGVQTQSLALREGDSWHAQGASGLGLGGSLDRIVAGGPQCEVYGLGSFTHLAGESAAGRVARFTGDGWQLLGDELPRDAYCPSIDVAADGSLAVACMLFPEDGPARGVVLQRQGDQLVELNLELPVIQTLKWSPSGKLWIAGGDAGGFVGTIEAGKFEMVSDGFDGTVQHLDVRADDDVLVAGVFTHVGDTAAERVAHYHDGAWQALGDGLLGQPQAIARDAERVYASTYDEGQGAYLLGAFDGKSWSELAGGKSGLAVEDFYVFNQILPIDGGLLLVGTAELTEGRGALVLEDGKLRPLGGGGVHAISVSGVAVAPNALWVGGVIAEAASGDRAISSVGVARLGW